MFQRSEFNLGPVVTSSAGSGRIAGLDHELLDDSVENVAIVVAISRMNSKILHSLGDSRKFQM